MNKWTISSLGKIASIKTGPFGSQLHKSDYVAEGVAVIMPVNIENRSVNIERIAYISETDATRLNQYSIKDKDIIYSRRGDVEKHAFINNESVKFLCGTGCLRVRVNDNEVYPEYVSLYLERPETKKWILRHVVGSSMPNLNSSILSNVPISYPAKEEQIVLSSVIANFDKKIELNDKINAELETMAKTIYDYWFLQFDFPNEEGKPYRSSVGKMVWNEQLKREIPEGWRNDKLADKLNFQRGVEPGSSAYSTEKTNTYSTPFIRVSDLGKDTALYISSEDAMDTYCGPENVLVSFDGTVGKVALAMEGAYSTGIRKITPKDADYSNALIYFIFQSKEVQSTISKYAVGSNILHASSSIEHLVFLYEKDIVGQFQKIIEPLYREVVTNHQENKELVELRDWLLPMLMNGQVTVEEADGA